MDWRNRPRYEGAWPEYSARAPFSAGVRFCLALTLIILVLAPYTYIPSGVTCP